MVIMNQIGQNSSNYPSMINESLQQLPATLFMELPKFVYFLVWNV